MQNNEPSINDLQRAIFKAIDDLNSKRIGVNHANAIANLSMASIAALRAECTYIDLLGGKRSGFIPEDRGSLPSRDQLVPVNRWVTKSA